MILPDTEVHPSPLKPTHAVDILAFIEAQEIPSDYFETPYYLAPAPGGEQAYAMLRETLRRTHKIGIAYVVIRARKHLAALVPQGQSLVLNTLRWTSEAGELEHFGMPVEDLLAARELAMMTPTFGSANDGRCDLDWHRQSYQRDFNALAEQATRFHDSPEIVVEEIGSATDEDDDLDMDEYLIHALRRKSHASSANRHRRDATGGRGHWHRRGR